jgi:hypothetical protein
VIYGLIDEGILGGASIQFMPTKAKRLSQKPEKQPDGVEQMWLGGGFDFVESSLWEWSPVAIPADPGALRKALSARKVAGQRISVALSAVLAQKLPQEPVQVQGVTLPTPAPPPPTPPEEQSAKSGEVAPFVVDMATEEVKLSVPTPEVAEAQGVSLSERLAAEWMASSKASPAAQEIQVAVAAAAQVVAEELRLQLAEIKAAGAKLEGRLNQFTGGATRG